MINYDKLEKAGEYKDGSLIWFTKKEENVVYLLMIGKDSYIGSSKNLHRRFSQHLSSLKSGKCMSKSLQNAFDFIGGFSVYILEKSQNIINREQYYIDKYKPSLNATKAYTWKRNARNFNMDLFINHRINLNSFCRKHNLSSAKIKDAYSTLLQFSEYSNISIHKLFIPRKDKIQKKVSESVMGFVKIGDTVHEVKSVEDMKNLVGML